MTETSGGSFITGGGNIYSFSVPTEFTATLASDKQPIEGTRTVVAHFKTLGTVLADDSVLLTVDGARGQWGGPLLTAR